MKRQFPIIAMLALTLVSCENETTTTSASTDTLAGDPNMITTTTTTTTTRPAFQPRADVQYMDLRTKKLISVRVDTVHHYIVNTVTNEPVDWILEPGTTDTFYGRNLQMANGYINYGSGSDWKWDENRAANSVNTPDAGSDVEKMKSNANETKIKMEDGSKIKSNANETKVKNKD